jgi:hypothetical protein
MDVDADF